MTLGANGVLSGFLSSRETAAQVGTGRGGSMRAVVPVPTPIEMTVLRERRALSDATLIEFFADAREVYQAANSVPTLSPHARFDVGLWRPIGRDKAAVA